MNRLSSFVAVTPNATKEEKIQPANYWISRPPNDGIREFSY